MKAILFTIVVSALFLGACNSNSNQTAAKKTTSTEGVINAYLQLKNALVNDNDQAAAAAGNELKLAAEKINKTTLTTGQAKVFNEIADDIKEHGEHIGSNAGNIKHQREHFEMLSQEIYDLVKTDDNSRQKLYYDHCPMYNNKKGGNWISETKTIANPYLGKEMPTCGNVKEELN